MMKLLLLCLFLACWMLLTILHILMVGGLGLSGDQVIVLQTVHLRSDLCSSLGGSLRYLGIVAIIALL